MATRAARYAQSFFGDEGNGLIGLPGASILIRVQGTVVAAPLWANRTKTTTLVNPLPTGVPYGTPGLDIDGNAVFYADPGDSAAGSTVYEAMVTVGNTTVGPIPIGTLPPDMADVQGPIAPGTYVATTGAQTIAGLKDFTTAPTVNGAPIGGGGGATPDADATTKGKVQLAGDLGGTAASPTVPGLALKAADSAVVKLTGAQTVAGQKTFSSTILGPEADFDPAGDGALTPAFASIGDPDTGWGTIPDIGVNNGHMAFIANGNYAGSISYDTAGGIFNIYARALPGFNRMQFQSEGAMVFISSTGHYEFERLGAGDIEVIPYLAGTAQGKTLTFKTDASTLPACPLAVQRAGTTTTDLFQLKDAAGAVVSKFDHLGQLTIGSNLLKSIGSYLYTDAGIWVTAELRAYGNIGLNGGAIVATGAALPALQAKAAGSQTRNIVEVVSSAFAVYSGFDKDGFPFNRKNAAPADADLAAGEMKLWFDQTNGAAKLMVKAKQADGTVRTAAVALA